jgi:hypothetical protein
VLLQQGQPAAAAGCCRCRHAAAGQARHQRLAPCSHHTGKLMFEKPLTFVVCLATVRVQFCCSPSANRPLQPPRRQFGI